MQERYLKNFEFSEDFSTLKELIVYVALENFKDINGSHCIYTTDDLIEQIASSEPKYELCKKQLNKYNAYITEILLNLYNSSEFQKEIESLFLKDNS